MSAFFVYRCWFFCWFGPGALRYWGRSPFRNRSYWAFGFWFFQVGRGSTLKGMSGGYIEVGTRMSSFGTFKNQRSL